VLILNNVSKTYSPGRKAVDIDSLKVPAGAITGFLGPNGAGKTTTIKMLTGCLQADAGEIVIAGIDIAENALVAKKIIGYVPDNPEIFPRLTIIEYLTFIADVYQMTEEQRNSAIESLTGRFGLQDSMRQRLSACSHGTRQKVILTGAIMHNPAVLILDEPLTGLDPRAARELKLILQEMASAGKTVFFSTHVLDVAEKICHRVAVIIDGKISFNDSIGQLRQHFHSDASLESIFLEMTENDA
jgi:ABC-2 type transport system ATP-binding protein